jgi:CrcB protein
MASRGNLLTPEARLFLAVGFCGGFTTFSSFAYNNLTLINEKLWQYLFLNVGGSLFAGIVAVYLGIVLVRVIF